MKNKVENRVREKKIIMAFLRWMRRHGYYIRIRDQGRDKAFSRSVDKDELATKYLESN